ncbi:Gfo/Idh/MocA family oxidoreductase [Fulvivirgaceae bacterium PWU4]|uniref:Gfo/Idh/MocA family oxidoreductase n=1 Tax=Chryseosolibacter histidini TaxID=2782349 RepID=A0AAP2DJ13_9BACT|nr:Gfo/Idh/MocA family oxidoreductase [Chryseosolibacter histidini]MBT1696122.1 Gfo/Idh/MocA family oxidoreductase [Chryseosolibacter histidini]
MENEKSVQSRREFVKQSSMLAGGLVAMPFLSHAGYNSSVQDTIKVALIGCGGRGTGAAMQAMLSKQNVKLVAMADAFRDRLDSCYKSLMEEGEENGVKDKLAVKEEAKFTGFDAYLKAIPLADVVILATPPGFRPIHFAEAIKQGKHVFMEKPVATDPAGVKKVLESAAEAKKKKLNVVVGLQRHYQNSYRELYKRVKDGMIGDITSGQVWWNNDGVWVKMRQPGQTEMEYQMRNWYYFNWLCGDHITEQHIHNIDVMNWFKGAYPVKAQGMGGRQVRTGKEFGEIYDHHYVEFEYADGSILNSQCRHIKGTYAKVDEMFVGTKGVVKCGAAEITSKGKSLYKFDKKGENNPYQTEHDELFAAIAKGEFKFTDAENGAYSTLTSIVGRMATYSGEVIDWDKTLNSGISIQPAQYSFDAQPPVLPDSNGFYPIATPGVTKYFS